MTPIVRRRFKVVVFDLDGTLADTANLSTGRRSPALVLDRCRAGDLPTELEFSRAVSRLPASVMQKGALVAVITRAPFEYATTLCYLLGIDYNTLFASRPHRTVNERLATILARSGVEPHQLLYVGDRPADMDAATEVGVKYATAPWLDGNTTDTGDIAASAARTSLLYGGPAPKAKPGSLLRALQVAARTGGSLSDEAIEALNAADIDDELRSAIAWMVLRSAPGQTQRTALQEIAFAAIPAWGYDCVIPRRNEYGLVCVSRSIMRRREYQLNRERRTNFFRMLRGLHPPHRLTSGLMRVEHPGIPVSAFRSFQDPRGGELLRTAKDWGYWGGSGKGESGPSSAISLIELPTVVIAATLALSRPSLVVPVPATAWSPDKPGQVSQRICLDAAKLADRKVLDVLEKSADGIRCKVSNGNGRRVVVVDDQYTTGRSVRDSVDALDRAGFDVRAVRTWSASERHWRGIAAVQTRCWLADARWIVGRYGNCSKVHRQARSADGTAAAVVLDAIEV